MVLSTPMALNITYILATPEFTFLVHTYNLSSKLKPKCFLNISVPVTHRHLPLHMSLFKLLISPPKPVPSDPFPVDKGTTPHLLLKPETWISLTSIIHHQEQPFLTLRYIPGVCKLQQPRVPDPAHHLFLFSSPVKLTTFLNSWEKSEEEDNFVTQGNYMKFKFQHL